MTHDLDKHRVDHLERLEVFQRRFDNYDRTHEEITEQIRRLQDRGALVVSAHAHLGDTGDMSIPEVEEDGVRGAEADASAYAELKVMECVARLGIIEGRVHNIEAEVSANRSDGSLAPRITSMVDSLKQVVPKVIDHEAALRDLTEKVGLLQARSSSGGAAGVSAAAGGGGDDAVAARVGRLESEVGRLRLVVEGEEAVDEATRKAARLSGQLG